MKTVNRLIEELNDKDLAPDKKKKGIKIKNKIMINPDFDKYQMKTHDDSDVSVTTKSTTLSSSGASGT